MHFNFLGGGDMDFFTRCRKAGFRFAWNARALIIEYVPESRMAPRWIMERSLRTGIINYSIDRARRPGLKGGLLLAAKNVVSLCLSLVRAVSAFLKTGTLLPATHPPLMSIGRVMASLGITLTPYKAPVKRPDSPEPTSYFSPVSFHGPAQWHSCVSGYRRTKGRSPE